MYAALTMDITLSKKTYRYPPNYRPTFIVRRDAAVGWLVTDFRHSLLAADDEILSILPSPHFRHFDINDLGQLITTRPLPKNITRIPIYIMATQDTFQRVISVHVEITDSPTKFLLDHYQTTICEKTENGSLLLFSRPFAIKGLPAAHTVRFAPITSIEGFPVTIISREDPKGRGFALIQLSDELENRGPERMDFYLGAFNEFGKVIATCRVTILVQEAALEPPKFDASRYFTSLAELRSQATVMRVNARTTKGTVEYSLHHGKPSPFDIVPFSGEIFTTSDVPPGKYDMEVVARNSIGQESTASVTVLVENKKDQLSSKSGRLRRELSDPVVIVVKENAKEVFKKRIPLANGEQIVAAPIVREHFSILADGTVTVTKPLNYEKTRELSETIEIDAKKKCT
ncbi:cadherin domain protein [Ancylostoma ceylanicum]|uniref:Cadherin domain protein n=1 Tax=Ancylostoma ceylanicum TaxID=53326 RepID=A0A0D6LL98_9BILA|nr:cadherin domain protein [Ancylostoma ceylanicum]